MKLFSPFLCLTTALFTALPLQAQSQAPQFASLTPATSPSSAGWVRDLNAMSQEERQRRVRTYGSPPAPAPQPGRPAPAPQSALAHSAASISASAEPPSAETRSQSLYQNPRPASGGARVAAIRAQVIAATVKQRVPTGRDDNRAASAGSAAPGREAAASRPVRPVKSVVPKGEQWQRKTHVFFQPAPPQRRSAAPSRTTTQAKRSSPPIPQAASERQAELRRQVAFMPSSRSTRLKNPWAPYESRAEYQRALSRTKWQPRGAVAERLEKQQATAKPKRRWSFASIFKRKSSPTTAKKQRSRNSAPAPASRKLPNSTYVTVGLPQPDRSSERMIDTTLFGG